MILDNQDLDSLIVGRDSTLEDVMRKLEESKVGICIICNEEGRSIEGTITDGDVRRCLLGGGGLDAKAIDIAEKYPIVCPVGLRIEEYFQISRMNSVRHLPLIDKKRQLEGLYVQYKEDNRGQETKAVIMAGGKGTRLRPLTDRCPKPMLQVGGKPMLERIINKMRAEGLTDISISIYYLKEVIVDYFGTGEAHGVNIDYIEEDNEMGTAGALGSLKTNKHNILVTNGDVLTDISYGDMIDFHKGHKADATMAVKGYEWVNPYGVVDIDGIEIVGFREKPVYECHVNAGIYVLKSDALDSVQRENRFDMPQLFERLRMDDKRTIVYPIHEPWIDIGRPEELERARITHAS